MSSNMRKYSKECPIYAVSSISLHCDLSRVVTIKPAPVSVERRIEIPFDMNVYFSSAPLRTADHVEYIRRFGELCR